jgi:hypothetical protein
MYLAQVGSGSGETLDFPPRAESGRDLTGCDAAYAEPPVAAAGRRLEAPEQELGPRPGPRRDALDVAPLLGVAPVVEGAVVHQQVERSHPRGSLGQSRGGKIDAGHGEAVLGQLGGTGAGAAAEVEQTAELFADHDQGDLARLVKLIDGYRQVLVRYAETLKPKST